VIFGINVYISVPLLLDPQIKPQTKVAIVFFLILGARSTIRANFSAYSYARDLRSFSAKSQAELKSSLDTTQDRSAKLRQIFGAEEPTGDPADQVAKSSELLQEAIDGKLKVPSGLTRDTLLAYRQLALRNIWSLQSQGKPPIRVTLQV